MFNKKIDLSITLMKNLDPNNISAIIGVSGTLLGVFLGFILNQISKIGKIKVYQNTVTLNILKNDSIGGFVEVPHLTDEIALLSINLNVDFFNTSSLSPKIARDIKFVIKRKGKRIEKNLENINLAPREIQNYKVTFNYKNNLNEIFKGDWLITFKNERDRLKKIRIVRNKNNKVL